VTPLAVTADHVKLYKRALLEAGMTSATVARRLSVLRGAYQQLAAKGLISWETAQDIAAIKAAGVQKNSTPSLTQRQAVALLEAIPTDTLPLLYLKRKINGLVNIQNLSLNSFLRKSGQQRIAADEARVPLVRHDPISRTFPRVRRSRRVGGTQGFAASSSNFGRAPLLGGPSRAP
jgi:site-specific recombinase XerD